VTDVQGILPEGALSFLNCHMTDEPPPPTLPPPPEHYQFPAQLLEQWVDLPPGEGLNLTLTRQDMDNLFFGLGSASIGG
jgi:hypothetical protein